MAVTVISFPNKEINVSFPTDTTLESDKVISYVWVDYDAIVEDTTIEITFNGRTVTLNLIEECRFVPANIFFQNKEGAEQALFFFKERTDSLNVTSDDFESDRGQPSDSFHQFVTFNVNGKAKFTVNSGFVSEKLNESFKQLFLSQRIWIVTQEGGVITETPLTISSKTLEFKTRQKDRVINYEVEFEFAFNEINTI